MLIRRKAKNASGEFTVFRSTLFKAGEVNANGDMFTEECLKKSNWIGKKVSYNGKEIGEIIDTSFEDNSDKTTVKHGKLLVFFKLYNFFKKRR